MIPQEELDANQLEFERHVASVLLAALSEGGLPVSEVEQRLEKRSGWFKRHISRLIDGKTGSGYPATNIGYACGVKIRVGIHRLEEAGE